MILETHAHYDDAAFDADRDVLLRGMPDAGIPVLVNVGANLPGSEASVALAQKYSFVYAAVGVHPDDADTLNEDGIGRLRRMAADPKVVAIGEIGLDYHWDNSPRGVQREWFERQMELANEVGLPIIIHSRDAAQDTMQAVRKHADGLSGGVVHCYAYSAEQAAEYMEMGFFLGIGGVLTFQNARKLAEVVRTAPLSRLVLETDSPYLAPVPYRGKRNDSRNLKLVAQAIAQIKSVSEEEVEQATFENALRLYPKIQIHRGGMHG